MAPKNVRQGKPSLDDGGKQPPPKGVTKHTPGRNQIQDEGTKQATTNQIQQFFEHVAFWKGNPAGFNEAMTKLLRTISYWRLGKTLLTFINVHRPLGYFVWVPQTLTFRFGSIPGYGDGEITYALDYAEARLKAGYRFDFTQDQVIACKKTYVYLFHELVHYLHDLQGTFSFTAKEEFRTVGLYQYKNDLMTENRFRKELGLPRRPVYKYSKDMSMMGGVYDGFAIRGESEAVKYDQEKRERERLGLVEQSKLSKDSKNKGSKDKDNRDELQWSYVDF